ncbi:hypothetical protein O4H26_06660 [Aequorivita viscosa]|nr:hypothetical protein [Aequorivita viscosa]
MQVFYKVAAGSLEENYNKTERVISDLEVLLFAGETAERHNLLGSAFKRLAMLAPNAKKRTSAYKSAISHYERAYNNNFNTNKIYSLVNSIEIGCLLVFSEAIKEGGEFTVDKNKYQLRSFSEAKQTLLNLKEKLVEKSQDNDLNYWDLIALLNINLCLLFLIEDDKIETKWAEVTQSFNKIWRKAGSVANKVAELEHLDFLTRSLNAAAGVEGESYKPNKDLETRINELKTALHTIQKKIKIRNVADKNLMQKQRII